MSERRAISIRPATEADTALVLRCIIGLAEYERLVDEATATEADVRASLFGARADAEVLLAFLDDEPAGMALFFHNYSTFLARRGLYLEDLFVFPEQRGHGVGRALLARLARVAIERSCGRFEWSVLDWNEQAIRVYRAIGARAMDQWTVQRLDGEALHRLAAEDVVPNAGAG